MGKNRKEFGGEHREESFSKTWAFFSPHTRTLCNQGILRFWFVHVYFIVGIKVEGGGRGAWID